MFVYQNLPKKVLILIIETNLQGLKINNEFKLINFNNYKLMSHNSAMGRISYYNSHICGKRVTGRIEKSVLCGHIMQNFIPDSSIYKNIMKDIKGKEYVSSKCKKKS